MILSKLFKTKSFKPKWQDSERTVRVEAINELNADNAEDKAILQNLLATDDAEIVRRAALIKLNNFEDYLQASKHNSHAKIKAFADKQIVKMLLGEHSISLTVEQKNAFLNETTKNSLLESWLLVEQDTDLITNIYKKLNKPHLLTTLFAKAKSPLIQAFLIEQCHELSLLEKLQKKALNEAIKNSINEKINQLKAQTEKPIKVRKNIQLLLAKLLALKDVADYGEMLPKRQQLVDEWQTLQHELTLFEDEEQQIFKDKYQSINQQLDKIFAPKKEQYEQQQIALKIKAEQTQAHDAFKQQLDELNQQLVTFVFEDVTIDHAEFKQKLLQLEQQIAQSLLNEQDKQAFKQKVNALEKRLAQLPEIAQSVSEATQLISKIAALTLPENLAEFNERYRVYKDWLAQWQQVERQADGLLPESITQAYQEIKQRWQQGVKPFIEQQEKLFHQTRKKLIDLKRLLNSGKYNTCFGLFKKAKQQFEQLSPQQQHKLQRDMNIISEKISELSDWEHYIATPRKQELLAEINELVNTPCDNPNEQAEKVKQYRKQWNMLGHADDEIDQQLNQQFNEACEQAFAPCRAFYAEQEQIRAQNYQNRLLLIEQAKDLVAQFEQQQNQGEDIDFKNFDHQLTKLTQKWQKSGEVERSKYKELLTLFNQALAPLKAAITQYHLQNMEQKKQLIKQAETIAQYDDSRQAIQEIKQLQSQWKLIGYAGSRQENKLWQSFRKVNDQIFAKRSQDRALEQSQLNEKEQHFVEQLTVLTQSLSNADNKQLIVLLSKAEHLHTEVLSHKPILKKVLKQVESFIEQVKQKQLAIQNQKQQQQWQTLFTLLTMIVDENLNIEQLAEESLFTQLSPSWQKRLQELVQLTNKVDRQEKTLTLEILAGIESPTEYRQQRMAIQVALMQEQMTAGSKTDLNALFVEWLLLGKLTAADLPQLTRIKKIFVSA